MKYLAPVFSIFLLLFAGCATSEPLLFSASLPGGGKLFYLPATLWKASGALAEIRPDITCRTKGDQQGTVNISFFGKKQTPQNIVGLTLGGDDFEYPLDDAKVLLERPERLELRLTASLPIDALKQLIAHENIFLNFTLDGTALQSPAPKEFYIYARQLGAALGD
jgi:hypothetical protein